MIWTLEELIVYYFQWLKHNDLNFRRTDCVLFSMVIVMHIDFDLFF